VRIDLLVPLAVDVSEFYVAKGSYVITSDHMNHGAHGLMIDLMDGLCR
jgi:hypothetical protein